MIASGPHDCNEATAFALLALLCGELLPAFYTPRMPGLHRAQDALMESLAVALPLCHRVFEEQAVPVRESSTGWLLCAFIDTLPLQVTLRVWDLFYLEGQPTLLRVAIAAIALSEQRVLGQGDGEEPDGGLKSIMMSCRADDLMRVQAQPFIREAVAESLVTASK